MSLGFPAVEVVEGLARLLVPQLDTSTGEPMQRLMSEAPVFYNPLMAVNRDTAVMAVRAHTRGLGREATVCEPMCGSGARGVRIALEAEGVGGVTMGDLSPTALTLAQANASRNGVQGRVSLRLLDASLLMSLHGYPGGRYDYVDVDPYGSPAAFIGPAVAATRNHGLLAVTATDMAPLCGVNPKACLRKYGGQPLRGELCHEAALRLVAGALVRGAAVHEAAATPVFSYYADHYVRVYARLDAGARRADAALSQMGYLKHCPGCLHHEASQDSRADPCPHCGSAMSVGGPMWMGELSEQEFTSGMLEEAEKLGHLTRSRAAAIVRQVRAEARLPPGFYVIDSLCSAVGLPSLPTEDVLARIRGVGFRVARTHLDERGIRTDADVGELKRLLGG